MLKVKVSGGAVQVGWGWGGHGDQLDMIRLEVDRGDGHGFVLLATDTTPNYHPHRTVAVYPAKWAYRGMYYVGDQPVDQWSDETSLNVGA